MVGLVRVWSKPVNLDYDVIIIGGGIQGVGVAQAAAAFFFV